MWDWAYKNGTTGSPSSTPTPAHCLSPPGHPTPGPSHPIDADADVGPRPRPLKPNKLKSTSVTPDAEEEEEEELPTPPRAMEEEEAEEADPRKDRPLVRRHFQHPLARIRPPPKTVVVPMPFDRTKFPRSKRNGIKISQSQQHDEKLKDLWERGYKLYDPNAPTTDEESINNTDDDDDRSPSPLPSDDNDEMDVDEDAEDQSPTSFRRSPTRPTLNTNLKPSPPPTTSVIDPTADNPSVPPSIRASVDPTASPPDEDVLPGAIPDEDIDQDHYPDALDDDDHQPAPDGDVEPDGDEDEDAQQEEPSQPPSPTPLAEPEPEPEDEDPDLQPAHRAEALDVLATIELKFALLRERVYVEKMEGLAWEEALVCDGQYATFSCYSQLISPPLYQVHIQSSTTYKANSRNDAISD